MLLGACLLGLLARVFVDFLPDWLDGWNPGNPGWLADAFGVVFACVCLYSPFVRLKTARAAAWLTERLARLLTWLILRSTRPIVRRFIRAAQTSERLMPSPWVLVGLAALAAAVVTVDILISRRSGLLSYPPNYDGIAYVLDAKRLYLHSRGPLDLVHFLSFPYWNQRAYLWHAAIAFSFFLFGVGEWQAYTARFWPTLLALTLVYWVVRRRAPARVAVTAVVVTALIPIFSPCLRACAWEYLTGQVCFSREWYLDDLRPDLFSAVLQAWAVALVVETGRTPDWRLAAGAGFALSLSALAKPSGVLGAGLVFVVALLSLAWQLRARRLTAVFLAATALAGAVPLGVVWLRAGALDWMMQYLGQAFSRDLAIYHDPYATGWNAIPYFANLSAYQIGHWEWLLPVVGFAFCVYGLASRQGRRFAEPLAYYGIAIVLMAGVCRSPATNLFLGLGVFLMVWIGAWTALASTLGRLSVPVLISFNLAYAVGLLSWSGYALAHWPRSETVAGPANRAVMMAVASDLKRTLRYGGTFTGIQLYGSPNALEYYHVRAR